MHHLGFQVAHRFIGRRARRGPRKAFSLIECLFALVILSLAVTAIAYAVTAGQMQSAEAFHQSRAAMLAEALMDEILCKPYGTPVNGSALARTARTHAGQYHAFAEAAGNLRDADGVLYPLELQVLQRSATVTAGTASLACTGSTHQGLFLTVAVSLRGRELSRLTRFMVKPS